MAGDTTGDGDNSPPQNSDGGPASSSSSSSSPSSSSETSQPFRDRSNAPRASYPLPSHHDHPPRSQSSKHPNIAELERRPQPPPLVTPPLFVLRGRSASSDTAPSRNDERCITYCTQTAERRAVGLQPICKTWCWRRLYPHDFLTVEQYQTQQAEAKEKASKGGKPAPPRGNPVAPDSEFGAPKPGIFGFDGRYVYYGRSRFRAKDRLDSMTHRGLTQDWSVDEMVSLLRSSVTQLHPVFL